MDGNWVGIKVGNAVGVVGAIAGAGGLPSAEPGGLNSQSFSQSVTGLFGSGLPECFRLGGNR